MQEVNSCDAVVLIIGGRFGGKGTPKALDALDTESLEGFSDEQKKNLSITQIEICKAIQENIPIYSFVHQKIYSDHHLYEINKESNIASQIKFPSIDNPGNAKFIFEFINFLRKRTHNNAIQEYRRTDEIEKSLMSQWSAQFQRLLRERKEGRVRSEDAESLREEIAEVKSVVVSAMSAQGFREVAHGVSKYRLLLLYVAILGVEDETVLGSNEVFSRVLYDSGVRRIEDIGTASMSDRRQAGTAAVFYSDKTMAVISGTAYSLDRFTSFEELWNDWRLLSTEVKDAIYDAIVNARRSIGRPKTLSTSDADLHSYREQKFLEGVEFEDHVRFINFESPTSATRDFRNLVIADDQLVSEKDVTIDMAGETKKNKRKRRSKKPNATSKKD